MKLCRNYCFMGCDAVYFGRQILPKEPIEIYSVISEYNSSTENVRHCTSRSTAQHLCFLTKVLYSNLVQKTGHFEILHGFVIP